MPLTLRLRSDRDDSPEILEAARVIRQGGIVVFPTETVYGIGAGLDFPDTALRVNRLKDRPETTPLLVHCAAPQDLSTLARTVPVEAFRLLEAFLPGPLALILPASDRVPDLLRGPGDTVGVRVVARPATGALIRRAGMPIAGSSANPHGAAASGDFAGLDPTLLAGADVVIDAGSGGSGVPSTIVDLASRPPRLLREGAIARRRLAEVLGEDWDRRTGQ